MRHGPGWRDLDGIAAQYPSLKAALERKNAFNATLLEGQGYARAGGLVRAGAVEHDVTVTGNVAVAGVQLLRVHANSSGQGLPVRVVADRRPQVQDADPVAGLEPESQRIRREASATKSAQDAALLDDAPRPVGHNCAGHDRNRGAPERVKPTHDTVELIVKSEAETDHDHVIEKTAETVEDEERRERHPEGACHRRGKEGQTGTNFATTRAFQPSR